MRFGIDTHTRAGTGKTYRRLRVRCRVHAKCGKYRGLGAAQTRHHGWREPFAFLMLWADAAKSVATARAHKKTKPSSAAIKTWLEEHGHKL